MLFPEIFIHLLIYFALGLCAVNCGVLIGMLIKEWRSGRLWK
jgi:hypothetical protein